MPAKLTLPVKHDKLFNMFIDDQTYCFGVFQLQSN